MTVDSSIDRDMDRFLEDENYRSKAHCPINDQFARISFASVKLAQGTLSFGFLLLANCVSNSHEGV